MDAFGTKQAVDSPARPCGALNCSCRHHRIVEHSGHGRGAQGQHPVMDGSQTPSLLAAGWRLWPNYFQAIRKSGEEMPLGRRALDATTPYVVYEFSYNGKIFYVGVAHGNVRHTRRWGHIANLVRHEQAGTLKPIKARALNQKSNAVLAALIRAGLPEHQWQVAWQGEGKKAAEAEEKIRIKQRLDEGCMLANIQHNPFNTDATLDQILNYLDVKVPSSATTR